MLVTKKMSTWLAQQKRFGASSEAHPRQGELFNEAEVEDDKQAFVEQEISYTRRQPTRQKLPKDLPREVIIHDIAEGDNVCDCCGRLCIKWAIHAVRSLNLFQRKLKLSRLWKTWH